MTKRKKRDKDAPIFYTYFLFRPWNGICCYVGKGKNARIDAHDTKQTNPHLRRIYAKAKRLGLKVIKIKWRENLTEAEAFETEVALIAAIGRKKFGGPLVNLTDGGDGCAGHTHTVSAKNRAIISASQKGRKRTPDQIQAMSERQMGKPSPRKGAILSPETRKEISLKLISLGIIPPSRKGATTPDHVRKKQSDSVKAYWAAKAKENAVEA